MFINIPNAKTEMWHIDFNFGKWVMGTSITVLIPRILKWASEKNATMNEKKIIAKLF